jgi:hypothetical protein
LIPSAERESLKPRQIGPEALPDEFSPRHFRFQDWAYRVQPNRIEGREQIRSWEIVR